MQTYGLPVLCFLLILGCHSENKQAPLFESVSPEVSGIQFVNQVDNTEEFNIFNYRNFYNGGGAAIGDINNDGLADVYLTSNLGDNKLYLNKGNFQFEDITEKAGVKGARFWSTGVVMVDINADGLLDIYVCNAGYKEGEKPENELFINNGNLTFTENAATYGLNEDGYTTHAAFFDYDLDGDLDCYILNNSFMPVNTLNYSNKRELYAEDWPVKDFLKGGGDKLLRNDNGKFSNVSKQAGIFGSLIGFGLGVTVGDVNGDNWPDLYVSNDFFERDYLYVNQKNGTFKEEIEAWVEHMSHASMGADMADINNDGFPEIFTTEMLPSEELRLKTTTLFENYNIYQLKQERDFSHQYMQNCLQLNNKDRTFSEIAYYAGVAASDWSWGALMFDADNDGWRDIYVCNGIYKDVIDQDFIDFFADDVIQKMALTGKKEQINEVISKMPSTPLKNKAFRNTGTLKFEDAGDKWGFTTPSFSNGAAYGDLDNDGDLDLIINNVNQPAFLYRNHSNEQLKNHHLTVRLKGKGQNTFAIGSKLTVFRGSEQLTTQLVPSRGFQSSVDYKMVIGLGDALQIDSLVVIWPDRTKTAITNPKVDAELNIDWATAQSVASGNLYDYDATHKALFTMNPSSFKSFKEDGFVDFYPEGLSFRMLSKEGPKATIGDVNGDGTEDVFIGAPAGEPACLYLQNADGSFVLSTQPAFVKDSAFEDTATLFFDADNDNDLDLFVGSGGNKDAPGSKLLQDRLYINDGKGNFTLNPIAISINGYNTSVAVPLDFDNDGDLDLFVGSRSVSGVYGVPPKHFLYQNDGKGVFQDALKTRAEGLKLIGMVTDAIMADVIPGGEKELVVVGEWTTPLIFKIDKGRLVRENSNLDNYSGWWSAVQAADLDGDGDQDLVLGNRGDNFYFNASNASPAKIWVWDFDKNGTVDKIMTRQVNGKDMPIPMKKELTTQLPMLKKDNLKHADYAKKSIQDLFSPQLIKESMVRGANTFKSCIAINQGNGQFEIIDLPAEVQFSSVCAIWCGDVNGDQRVDIVLAGNDAGFMPQFSKLDASFGHTLINRGSGKFERLENRDSGFFVRGDVKTIKSISILGKNRLLLTVNGKKPLWAVPVQ
ncbi:MAG: VCBS repeat-containing protein [Saprospiraceae bacterium]|nr:VCBS repeat-containing protein [Saprospiraceae bacterium]